MACGFFIFGCTRCGTTRTYGAGFGLPDNQHPLIICKVCGTNTVHIFNHVSEDRRGVERARSRRGSMPQGPVTIPPPFQVQ